MLYGVLAPAGGRPWDDGDPDAQVVRLSAVLVVHGHAVRPLADAAADGEDCGAPRDRDPDAGLGEDRIHRGDVGREETRHQGGIDEGAAVQAVTRRGLAGRYRVLARRRCGRRPRLPGIRCQWSRVPLRCRDDAEREGGSGSEHRTTRPRRAPARRCGGADSRFPGAGSCARPARARCASSRREGASAHLQWEVQTSSRLTAFFNRARLRDTRCFTAPTLRSSCSAASA